jgi:hypothetical protein
MRYRFLGLLLSISLTAGYFAFSQTGALFSERLTESLRRQSHPQVNAVVSAVASTDSTSEILETLWKFLGDSKIPEDERNGVGVTIILISDGRVNLSRKLNITDERWNEEVDQFLLLKLANVSGMSAVEKKRILMIAEARNSDSVKRVLDSVKRRSKPQE